MVLTRLSLMLYSLMVVVEAFHGSDQVVIDVIQPHGCCRGIPWV